MNASQGLSTMLTPFYVLAHLILSTTFHGRHLLSAFYRWENPKIENCPSLHCRVKEEAELGIEPRQSGSRVRIPVSKCRKNEGNGKSPLEYHNNNCCRQDQLYVKISGLNFEKQDICTTSKHLPQNIY